MTPQSKRDSHVTTSRAAAPAGETAVACPTPLRLDDLCLGRTSPKKVVHHERCRHARVPYNFARNYADMGGVGNFAYELVATGAWRWHHFCQACCGDVDDAVRAAVSAVSEAIGEPYE